MSSLLLKIKKAVETATTFNHVPFKSGPYSGKLVGLSKNKKNFYINVECKEREGAGFRTRTATVNIDPEIGLAFEDFEEQVDSEEITKLVFSLFGRNARVQLIETFTPQYEGQNVSIDSQGTIKHKFGSTYYSNTKVSACTEQDILLKEPSYSGSVVEAESAY